MADSFNYDIPRLPDLSTLGINPVGTNPLTTVNLPSSPTFQDIYKVLTTPRQSYTEMTLPNIVPLLAPQQGLDASTLEAIANVQKLGQEGIRRGVSAVGTAAQRRGITGSSIEAGAIGEAARAGEMDILSQITPMIAQDAEIKRQQRTQLASFLQSAFGVDFSEQSALLDRIATLFGEELSSQRQAEMARQAAEQAQSNAMWGGVVPAVGDIVSAGINAASRK